MFTEMCYARTMSINDWVILTRARTGGKKPEMPTYQTPSWRTDNTKDIPSAEDTCFSTEKKEPKKYTGTLVKGIATMHKSNAVPVIDKEQAKDISNMRRN